MTEITPDFATIFGSNLRAARLSAGLNQSDVAHLAGVTQQHLSHIENGNRNVSLQTMTALAQAVRGYLPTMLEVAGVAFTNGKEPGVKLRKVNL